LIVTGVVVLIPLILHITQMSPEILLEKKSKNTARKK